MLTEKQIIAIEDDLIDLYKLAGNFQNTFFQKNDYMHVNSGKFAWPNFIFNVNISPENSDEIINNISKDIEQKLAPPFIITGTKSEKSFYEEQFLKHKFRKIMEWKAMAFDLKLLDFKERNDVVITRVINASDLFVWNKIISQELFNKKEFSFDLSKFLSNNEKIDLFIGKANDNPVCSLLAYYSKNFVNLHMIATSSDYRRKG
ncbi:MAG: hypothetical protein JXR68_01435, partial [Bacteroidales bacterium]|nr:hypothetical protein [Bacteroidales bacterium]